MFQEEGGKNCLQTGMENCTLNSNLGGSSFIHNISRRYSSLKLKGGKANIFEFPGWRDQKTSSRMILFEEFKNI